MYFDEISSEDVTSRKLLSLIEKNSSKARTLREKISRLKENTDVETFTMPVIEDVKVDFKEEKVAEEKNEFEDEIKYYLDDYRMLDEEFSRDDLMAILPSRKSYNFKMIAIRLQAEAVKEIKEINDFINEEKDLIDSEELEELKKEIERINRKRKMLKEILFDEKVVTEDEEVHNRIVLVPTLAGNIRIIDDIEHLPTEFYASFLELINSIVDGSFKKVKRFTENNYLNGVSEVRGFKVRVVFSRLDKNSYALITAFIKKVDNGKEYQEFLKKRVWEYKGLENSLKENIKSCEFMENNDFYVKELFNILDSGIKNKSYKKGGLNE